jgi:hypothetical protein
MRYALLLLAVAGLAALGAGLISASDDRISHGTGLQLAQAGETPSGTTGVRVPPEAAATVLDHETVQGILGRKVVSSAGEDMGRVIDVVVDRNGQVRAAVIDFGGFLGVGNRKVAVDWNALHFAPAGSKDDRITLDLTRDQVKAAPEYKDGQPLVVLGTAESLPSSPLN